MEHIPKNYRLLECVTNTVPPAPPQDKTILQYHHITVIKTGHHLHAPWSQTLTVEGFKLPESMHGLRYMWMIGDDDSSVHHSVMISVPYGHRLYIPIPGIEYRAFSKRFLKTVSVELINTFLCVVGVCSSEEEGQQKVILPKILPVLYHLNG